MILDRVTITGADDSIDPERLYELSERYPFVEWGILFSQKRQGAPRYPHDRWIAKLLASAPATMNLSAHLCGKWTRDIVIDGVNRWEMIWQRGFNRVQLNFHAEPHNMKGFKSLLCAYVAASPYPFIMQCDNVHDGIVQTLVADYPGEILPLFDTSGGAGILPLLWPRAWKGVYCGYAGGLGPDNVTQQLTGPILDAGGDERIWIDAETRVRSDDDRQFDLAKVRDVLDQAAAHVVARA